MLVFNRRRGEEIIIGDNIVITVDDIRGHKVRLAVEAPRSIPIMRAELVGSALNDHAHDKSDTRP